MTEGYESTMACTCSDSGAERREGDPQHAGGAAVQEEYTAHDSKRQYEQKIYSELRVQLNLLIEEIQAR